ncbi:MAG: hypothetical protein JWO75_492 [Actinomycetia bacterium]|nr:hypothetical protein [Actinomycetes bacterium]
MAVFGHSQTGILPSGKRAETAVREDAGGHESDSELMQDREQDFHVAIEQRAPGLQDGDGLDRVRAPDRLLTRLAQPEVPHLSRVDELLHRAGDVFDGHRRVRAVLVQQVDVVGAEEAEGVLDDLADVRTADRRRPAGRTRAATARSDAPLRGMRPR